MLRKLIDYFFAKKRPPLINPDLINKIEVLAGELREKDSIIQAQNERLRGILETQFDPIIRVDKDLNITYANSTYSKIFFGGENCVGKSALEKIHSSEMEQFSKCWKSLFIPPYRASLEFLCCTHNSGERWFQWEGASIFDENGEITEIQAVGRDTTVRKMAEERLATQFLEMQRKNRLLEVIIYASSGYMWYKDYDGRYLFCDRKFRKEFFGLKADEDVVGRDDFALISSYKDKQKIRHDFGGICVSTDVHSQMQGGQCKYIEGGYIGNKLFIIEVVKTPHFDDLGRYLGTIGFAWDRSETAAFIKQDIDNLRSQNRALLLSENDYSKPPFVYWILPSGDYKITTFEQGIAADINLMEQRKINSEINNILCDTTKDSDLIGNVNPQLWLKMQKEQQDKENMCKLPENL